MSAMDSDNQPVDRSRLADMETPILYVKKGCPYCREAKEFLDERKVAYREVEVRGDEEAAEKLKDVSGQSKTPTLVLGGKVLSNFGTDDLEKFLRDK